jgi:DNA invertase Pin-like site-specific DNA recombinase
MGLEHAKRKGKKLGRPKLVNEDEKHRLRKKGLTYSQTQKQLGIGHGSVFRAP